MNGVENMVGRDFKSLAHRVVYSYTGTFPEFVPVKSELAPEASQRQLYSFLQDTAQKLYEHPEYIGLPVKPDGCYPDWELQNRKPDLINSMRSMKKKLEDFYLLLVRMGQAGVPQNDGLYVKKCDMKPAGNVLSKLSDFGLRSEADREGTFFRNEGRSGIFPAWRLLSAKAAESGKPAVVFSHCMLSASYPYFGETLPRLIENKVGFNVLTDFFEKNGYTYVDGRETGISMDWYKNYGKEDEPLKTSWAEREHGGLSVDFDYTRRNQLCYGLRIPEFSVLLAHFDAMDDRLKKFVTERTKKCDSCGYCTQTDKTGARKKQLISVKCGKEYKLCLMFPGFAYRWTSLDRERALDIIGFLTFTDTVLKKEQ